MEEEKYYIEGEFVFTNYNPPFLEKGMAFMTQLFSCLPEPEMYYFTIDDTPHITDDDFKANNGFPVKLSIATTLEYPTILANDEEIGMFDNGSGFLRPITENEINTIINQYGSIMDIETDVTGEPILHNGKVIISYLSNPESEED